MKIDLMKNDTYSESQLTGLVILRILIGWHFLYEGISKLINLIGVQLHIYLIPSGFCHH